MLRLLLFASVSPLAFLRLRHIPQFGPALPMRIVDCTLDVHGEAILAILNEAIVTSTALYDDDPRTMESMREWFAIKAAKNFPVLGLVTETGQFAAFSTYGTFRSLSGYRYTVEHSVYVHPDYRGRGYGERMMLAVIEEAKERGMHVMVGVIDASNQASVTLHEKLGFTHGGTLREIGYKFDRWLDVVFYQLVLKS